MKYTLGPKKYETEFTFTIPETEKIGVFVSGGLDSAILLCMIVQELQETNRAIPIETFTVKKHDGSTEYAPCVINWIKYHYNIDIIINNHIENEDIDDGRVGRECIMSLLEQNPSTLFYMGISRQPSPDIKVFHNNLMIKYPDEFGQLKFPFLNMIKPNMVDLYSKLNVSELIPFTHSCTVLADDFCDNCYSCEERAWAFEELNINSTFKPL